ncbi:MAG: TetR/AcrR family transcriptional regulator [Sandaracinaceae bacterium]|nr:TetR/AcrR family transcriptional regulator [Sandaracinaceae bacterium]
MLFGGSTPEDGPDPLAEKILDAAYEQFRLLGIRRSSMDDIAKRAGVGRVTIYRRFENKDRLVQTLLLRETQRAVARVDERTSQPAKVEDRMAESFVAAMQEVRSHPLLLALLRTEPETILPLLTVKASLGLAFARTYVANKLREGRAEMGLPDVNLDPVAEIFARMSLSMLLTPRTSLPVEDDEEARAFARRHLVPMVLWDAPPA